MRAIGSSALTSFFLLGEVITLALTENYLS